MGALNSLRPAVAALTRNPVIVLASALVALLQIPQLFAQSVHPLLGSLVSLATSGLFVFVLPFYLNQGEESRRLRR